jgi:hypothetical protein
VSDADGDESAGIAIEVLSDGLAMDRVVHEFVHPQAVGSQVGHGPVSVSGSWVGEL